MKEETDKLTKTDLKKFTFSAVSLFVILVLPKLNLLNLWTKILDILSFNSNFYNFKDPAIFFSVGEAISALAILLAIYQIKKEKWNLSLKIRGYITKVILVTISLGILFSIISSLVIFITPKYVFHLSIFWQILSSIFIAFSVIFLLTKATKKIPENFTR
jgi:membrane-associated HD superfamily phosphohydrolase